VPIYAVARISPVVAATVAAGGLSAKRGTQMSAAQPIKVRDMAIVHRLFRQPERSSPGFPVVTGGQFPQVPGGKIGR
jgi:hypothetical protein